MTVIVLIIIPIILLSIYFCLYRNFIALSKRPEIIHKISKHNRKILDDFHSFICKRMDDSFRINDGFIESLAKTGSVQQLFKRLQKYYVEYDVIPGYYTMIFSFKNINGWDKEIENIIDNSSTDYENFKKELIAPNEGT